jgi:hypothetical protein
MVRFLRKGFDKKDFLDKLELSGWWILIIIICLLFSWLIIAGFIFYAIFLIINKIMEKTQESYGDEWPD